MTAAVAQMSVLDALNREYSQSPQRGSTYSQQQATYDDAGMDIEEDHDFLQPEPAPELSASQQALPPSQAEPAVQDDNLEEDETFFHQPQPDVNEANHAVSADGPPPTEDLEEDLSFLEAQQPQHSTCASSSTRTNQNTALPSSPVIQDEDQDLPDIRSVFGNVSKQRLDVGNLDLGQRQDPHLNLSGTSYDGRTLVFKRKKGNMMIGESSGSADKDPAELGRMALSLLDTPIHILMSRIEGQANDKAIAAALAQDTELPAGRAGQDTHLKKASKGKGKQRETDIWTDRYKPKQFTELLGDERTHRQAMSWLKEWDSCVFRSTQSAAAKKKAALKRSRDAMNASNKENAAFVPDMDPYHRPNDKILMLTGPPGLGKTTLAHVIAHQAGYQTREINASDDRTAKVVHDRIRQSLETRSMTTLGNLSSSKPTCLIIDEIDGAAGGDSGFIRTLVKLIQDGSKVSKYKGKGKKDTPQLLRPIICICNDLYAPALRPLRTLARIVRFHAPTTAHLTKRLRTICDAEGLKTDNKSLTTLVEVAEGDMRSCLNTLQVIKSQTTTLDEKVIKSTALGLKDTSTSVTAVWDKLFKIPAKKRQKGVEEVVGNRYVNTLVKDIVTCGEYDKLAQTCFENYLKVKAPVDGLNAITKSLDWLSFYDRMDSQLRSSREYDIMPYLAYSFPAWNPLFAAVSNQTPEWPKVDYENYMKRTAHEEIADTMAKSLPLGLKSLFTSSSVVMELAPLLVRIISPDLKPVNQQLVKTEDRQALRKLVKQMLDMNVSFVTDRNEEGQIIFKLEPQLDVFVHYEGKRAPDLPPARYNLRQLIAKELEAETVRRAGGSEEVVEKGKQASDIINAYKDRAKDNKAKPAKDAAPVAVDFFGRPIAVKSTISAEGADNVAHMVDAGPPAKKAKIVYRYQEGFSNAVRTNVKVLDLFR